MPNSDLKYGGIILFLIATKDFFPSSSSFLSFNIVGKEKKEKSIIIEFTLFSSVMFKTLRNGSDKGKWHFFSGKPH